MPRLARLDAPGVLHHVIIRGIERRGIFRDDFNRENFLKCLSTRDVIYTKACRKIQVATRSLLCYWAVRELGLTATELAKRLGVTQPVVSCAVSCCEQIARERKYRLVL